MNDELTPYQLAIIQAYRNILRDIKAILPQYPTRQMRTYIEQGTIEEVSTCDHSLYSPIFYVSLTLDIRKPTIAFSCNHEIRWRVEAKLETAIPRIIYRNTEKTVTAVDIEDCLEPLIYVEELFDEAQEKVRKRTKGYKRTVVKFKEA